MENAKILHVEDNKLFSKAITRSLNLENQGHAIIETATNIEDASNSLYRIARNEININLVLLDGNLSRESSNGSDAKRVIEIMRKLNLELFTIGCSEDNLKINSVDVDFELPKKDFGIDKLIALINSI